MNLKRIDAAVAAYRKAGVDEGTIARLEFFRSIWGIQDRYAGLAAGTSAGRPVPAAAELEEWYWGGAPLLSHAPADVDADLLAGCARELAAHLAERGSLEEGVAAALRCCDWGALVASTPLDAAGCDVPAYLDAASARARELCPGCADVVPLVLSLALRAQLEPVQEAYMAAIRRDVAGHGMEHLKPARCPVCGSEATLAYVGRTEASSGNGRQLCCTQCGCVWDFERIRCPHCGTTEQTKLRYVSAEGDDAHRLYECDACGGSIRTSFYTDEERRLAAFVPEVEDVVTVPLAALAVERAGQAGRRL